MPLLVYTSSAKLIPEFLPFLVFSNSVETQRFEEQNKWDILNDSSKADLLQCFLITKAGHLLK